MKAMKYVLLSTLVVLATACSTETRVSSRDVVVDQSYSGGGVNRILVLSILPDKNHDSRVIIERTFAQTMKAANIDAIPGYTLFDSLDELTGNEHDYTEKLESNAVEAVLFLDPIRMDVDYDPTEYDNRRTIYRAMGMETAESVALWSKIAHESSSAKVILNAGLWPPGGGQDMWNATYDITAHANYNVEVARKHSAVFAERVIADLRTQGLVK